LGNLKEAETTNAKRMAPAKTDMSLLRDDIFQGVRRVIPYFYIGNVKPENMG
jgi:hypothetical protein